MSEITHFSKLVRVSSTGSVNPAKFKVDLDPDVHLRNVKKISLKSIRFPNYQYNIQEGINDTLIIESVADGTQTLTISPGFYNTAELMTVIETAYNALAITGTMTVSQAAYTYKITIAMAGDTFSLTDANILATLGYTEQTSAAASHTAEAIPQLHGLESVHLVSKRLSSDNIIHSNNSLSNQATFCEIPVTVPFGAQNIYISDNDDINSVVYPHPREISTVDIELHSEDGRLLNINPMHDVEVFFKIFYKN